MTRLLLFAGLLVILAQHSLAQTNEHNNFIVLWERVLKSKPGQETQFRSHLMLDVPQSQAKNFFDSLTPSAKRYGSADIAHAKSPLCFAEDENDPHFIDTTDMQPADKLAPLRGLKGVHVDMHTVRGPRTYSGNFGQTVHEIVVKMLTDAGIPLLSKEQLSLTPGKPNLTFRYSAEVSGCRPWSVSLSLKQTAVLTRDTRILMDVKTWAGSARQSEDDSGYGPLHALQDAVTLFVSDFAKANSVVAINAVADTARGN